MTSEQVDAGLGHLRDRPAVLPDVLADDDRRLAGRAPRRRTARCPARRSGTRRRRRSWAGGACRSGQRTAPPRRTTAWLVGRAGAPSCSRVVRSPTVADDDRQVAEPVRGELGRGLGERALGAAAEGRRAARGPRSGSRSGTSRGTRRGRRRPRRPCASRCAHGTRVAVEVTDAGVDLGERDADVCHGPTLLRGPTATVAAHAVRGVRGVGCPSASGRMGPWTGSRSSCSARSRSGTSASSASGSPTCSASSSRWRSRPPSSRRPSRRASGSTAARSRASPGSTRPT